MFFFSYEALCSVAVKFGSVRLAGWFGLLDLGAVIVGGGNLLPFPGPIPLLIYLTFLDY